MEDDGRTGLCARTGMRELLSGRTQCNAEDGDVEVPEAGSKEIVSDKGEDGRRMNSCDRVGG